MTLKHWSKVEYLHESVRNPNIHIKGTHSYYSDAWTGSFEESVVRYHYGDDYSLKHWQPLWDIDQLYIGDYVCFAAETIILMGGNNTHRIDWFSPYPFESQIKASYQEKGPTRIDDGVWVGMRSMIMPGIHIGEGAVIAAGSVVTKDVPPYAIMGGNPAKIIKYRFDDTVIKRLLAMKLYDLPEQNFAKLIPLLCNNDIVALEKAYADAIKTSKTSN